MDQNFTPFPEQCTVHQDHSLPDLFILKRRFHAEAFFDSIPQRPSMSAFPHFYAACILPLVVTPAEVTYVALVD